MGWRDKESGMNAIQYAQTVAAEQEQMFQYLEWLQEKHPDNEVFRMHGADDGGVIAWQTGYLWDDFMESVK
jgi:alpha/beta superfamily hydrolase